MKRALRALSMMEALGIHGELIEHEVSGRTSEEAADALGIPVNRVLKSLVFVERGNYVFVITSGDRKVDLRRLRSVSGLKRPRLARHDEVLSILGYEPGGIPPLRILRDHAVLHRSEHHLPRMGGGIRWQQVRRG